MNNQPSNQTKDLCPYCGSASSNVDDVYEHEGQEWADLWCGECGGNWTVNADLSEGEFE